MHQRIYLDNAATTWPKPPAVYAAVDDYMRANGAPTGRSVYREAFQAERLVSDARRLVAQLVGAERPEQVIFTSNGSDSLNLAIHGILRPGDHVVTTVVDHNSVLRPLRHCQEHRDIRVTHVGCDARGIVDAAEVERALRPDTRLVAVIHGSNVTGALQPIRQIARITRSRGVLLLVDAAQTLGHVPLDVRRDQIDLLAAPGHKGLLGPLGTGLLYLAPGIESQLEGTRQGGTGTRSEEDRQPDDLPDKYEPGNHNVPGLAGLAAGVRFVLEQGVDRLRQHQRQLTQQLLEGMSGIAGLTIHGPRDAERQVGVVSVTLAAYDPQEMASALDASFRIQVRAGLHCAPHMHRALGTLDRGGTVRFSLGPLNTEAEVDATVEALHQLTSPASHRRPAQQF